ncbi:unannotated protein [freshwater metagenome]|uniref:Unannotated protein n=1 Tax=freshwater metagenome TaxID=449393 RepID=A0A6J7EWZ6_9ZZZZ|nr:hypothetical protein [Actinomycetota bacterium]
MSAQSSTHRFSTPSRVSTRVQGGMSMAVGSLPHLSIADALSLSMSGTDIVTIPTLPKRSPAENMIAQALVGLRGVTVGQYGSIAVDAASIDPLSAVHTDLDHEAFASFRSFLSAATTAGLAGPIKWQFVGPITLGLALQRAGVPASTAFDVAVRAVRSHVQRLLEAVSAALPGCEQIVVLDEPGFDAVLEPGFALPPDVAADLLSGALAVIEPVAVAGVHCCAEADLSSLIAAGPTLLVVPARPSLVDSAGYLQRYLDSGGWIAWGAVATAGPVPMTAERPWKQLCALWCQLVQRGCDPSLLRQQSLITPECGLGTHSPAVAERVLRINAELSRRVRDQAAATRFAFGA